ncbi:hypothetical protein BHE74_00003903 [Ensete ventricosum]|uniref:Uncharacterized protein n=1 Tax=Ensete ventricosum TaxID=4639 RepID=A0A444FYD4_ENSVE|nr:hypothetical protein B296_00029286 [Ensete ventricosum]RWW27628.1 hypothetical protein GW17_00007930 [Ensete ventricosum]RWW87280.1 hypothetical protein BHE74_00003903 [Ensete ventricosum]RZR98155.1 hypothetical protein BHM03_00027469 [Ensete ventricosum]
MEDRMLRLRAAANTALSRYEPLALVVAPLLTLLLARSLHALFRSVREKGIKAAVLGLLIASVKFSHTNPLHQDVFQSVARYEAEVVAMTAALLGSREQASGGQICGNMTSGGTERSDKYAISLYSIYMLIGTPLEFKQGIKIVGSAPGFPHGVIDPIELFYCHHVCYNIMILTRVVWISTGWYPIPPFDFSVKGVTSISTDVHKYGLGPKGTSVVLYRNREIRKHLHVVEDFLRDLRESVKMVKENPGPISGGLAPLYGTAGKMPDRGIVQDLLVEFMDSSC